MKKEQRSGAPTTGEDREQERTALLANALEGLSEMVVITDLDHNIIYANSASRTILGYRPEEMIGHKASEFFKGIPGNPPSLVKVMAENHSPEGIWKSDIFNRKKDGTLINVHLALNGLWDKNNRLIGFVGISTDITLRKKMEQELKEANEELKKLDQLKSDFLSSVSHELRTPLTSIRSFADILLDTADVNEETRREFLTIIREDTDRLTRLINNVLDISRIETGTIHWEESAFNLTDQIRKACRAVEGMTLKDGVPIEIAEDGGPYPVYADPDRIQQVVINLLSNAIACSPPHGKIKISVSSAGQPESPAVRVTVSDQGPGIKKDYWEKIFNKFVQVPDGDSRKRGGGTGLGLSICREIIRHHGGEIRVETSSREGSIISFTLPFRVGDSK